MLNVKKFIPTVETHPVFDGFDCVKYPMQLIARVLAVDQNDVLQSRKGIKTLRDIDLVLLTLVLAHRIDELENAYQNDLNTSEILNSDMHIQIEEALIHLEIQESINNDFPATVIREGAQNFRKWWLIETVHKNKT